MNAFCIGQQFLLVRQNSLQTVVEDALRHVLLDPVDDLLQLLRHCLAFQ